MKNKPSVNLITGSMLPVILLLLSQSAFAQVPTTQVMPDTAKITYNQISQALGLFVYPSKNQSKQKQKQDEFECSNGPWNNRALIR